MRGEHSKFQSFAEFYPFYLGEHQDRVCRRLHFAGSALVVILLIVFFLTLDWRMIILLPVAGYGFAWAGHFFFEKNQPATFKYPFYSLAGDWVMFKDILTGKLRF